ncbi:hypothetical protein ONS95_008753 [Cadophora gregata]|uniref:uncharacterized protein n=1 Tax=Cadophora gregata TaxID=51156 RepID=UPI0026DD556B|nr:uncharacterized protein ONS95_008753 [Cadophora gregata]KAK0123746.1 hypothetical protein ONS95_008753 [Cadophora gregata]
MPHKHTRKGQLDKATVDLPPTTVALPLSVSKSASSNGIFTSELSTSKSNNTKSTKNNNKKRKRKDTDDDTPKAFQRLMAFAQGKKLPKGLDDGVRETKKEAKKKRVEAEAQAKSKSNQDGDAEEDTDIPIKLEKEPAKPTAAPTTNTPTIRPGERLSDFSARVDAALPVAGLINKSVRNGKDPLGLKVGRTKTEKRMHRMYDEWRAEEARIQEKRMEARELAEEDEMDSDGEGQVRWKVPDTSAGVGAAAGGKKNKKKGKKGRKKVFGEVDDGEDDPWANIGKNRGEVKAGLNDVVLEPPTFNRPPKEKFKVKGTGGAAVEVGDVPRKSGSLRRREELGAVRTEVVRGYREMMKGKGKDIVEEEQ